MLLCFQCEDDDRNVGTYYVKNQTDQTLHLLQNGSGYSIYTPGGIVAPGDSIQFGSVSVRKKRQPRFEMWIQDEVARQGEEVSLKISSEEGLLLKEWRYLDRDQSGKQFFNESFWRHYDVFINDGARATITDVWVFTILPEDINQPNY